MFLRASTTQITKPSFVRGDLRLFRLSREERACSFVRVFVRARRAGTWLSERGPRAWEKAGIARGVRMRRFKHIWERRENRRSSASAAHLERLGLREHEPFLLGERGDRLLFLGRGRLLLLGGHRAAEGGPRAPEWGGRRIARAETSATQNELTRFARDAQLVRMREQSRDSGERAYRENCANSGVSVAIRGRTRRAAEWDARTAANRLAVAALV